MHDLDAIVPQPIRVRVAGNEYEITPRDGLPLSAVLEAQRFSADPEAQRDPEQVAKFLALVTPIPLAVLRSLRIVQFNALLGILFPKDAAPESAEGNA